MKKIFALLMAVIAVSSAFGQAIKPRTPNPTPGQLPPRLESPADPPKGSEKPAAQKTAVPKSAKKTGTTIFAGLGTATGSPIAAGADFTLPTSAPLTLGVIAGYAAYSRDVFNIATIDQTVVAALVRFGYHFGIGPDKLDTYAVCMLGAATYDFEAKYKKELGIPIPGSYGISGTEAMWGLCIGAKYFFLPHVGAFAEMGYNPMGLISGGVVVKL